MAVDESGQKKRVPHGLWTKCPKCEQIIYNKELAKNLKVCPKCHYPLRTSARERLAQLVDEGTFEEIGASLAAADPLGFVDTAAYADRIKESRKKNRGARRHPGRGRRRRRTAGGHRGVGFRVHGRQHGQRGG
jgi:acetyl-CoA carboxylase beta subunit